MNNDKIIKAIKNLWVKGFLMSIVAFLLASIAMFFGAASVAAMFFTGNITNLAGLLGLALVWVLIYITLAGFAVEAINKFKFPKVKKLTDVCHNCGNGAGRGHTRQSWAYTPKRNRGFHNREMACGDPDNFSGHNNLRLDCADCGQAYREG